MTIKSLGYSLLAFIGTAGPAPMAAATDADQTLAAFVGDWVMTLYADPETFGDGGGDGRGTMRCVRGALASWVDCELDAQYAGLGHYAMKLILYPAQGEAYGAFVTNSWGGGRLYTGKWISPNELQYRDAWIDPSRKWAHQRVTYTFARNDELNFAIDVSQDGVDFLPHSRGSYRRK